MISRAIDGMSHTENPLVSMISADSNSHIGYTIHASYADMLVITNDHWRHLAGGLPMNSYVMATALEANRYSASHEIDRRVVLLRIAGRSRLDSDSQAMQAIVEYFQDAPDDADPSFQGMEPISYGMLQWSGID